MPVCPICASTKFRDYNGRVDAVCTSCGSLERTRYLWLYLLKTRAIAPDRRVLHVAPEKCLTKLLQEGFGSGYRPVDFEPERYATDDVSVEHFDLCSDTYKLEQGTYDLIMHLHVLEHIPCAVDSVLAATMRALKPGGRLIFGIPIADGITVENLWPDLTREERIATFGQHDHLRRFGSQDFPRFLARVLEPFSDQDTFQVHPAEVGEDALKAAAIPVERARRLTGDTLFSVVRAA
jgi:SAM-dependent methyltransferase